jgi:hypothetical protein
LRRTERPKGKRNKEGRKEYIFIYRAVTQDDLMMVNNELEQYVNGSGRGPLSMHLAGDTKRNHEEPVRRRPQRASLDAASAGNRTPVHLLFSPKPSLS